MTSNNDKSSNIINGHNSKETIQNTRLVEPIDRYTALIVRGAIIGTGMIGLTLVIRNSRSFATYQHVKQIPEEYYRRGIPMKGILRAVEPNGLLRVEHLPKRRLPKFLKAKKAKPQSNLNLNLAGLEVSPVGIEYLIKDIKLKNRPIQFTLLKPTEGEPDIGDADVTAKQAIRRVNLNTELVRKGFARTFTLDNRAHREALQFNRAYSRLISRLLTCEKVAEHRGLGIWERATWVESLQSYPSTIVQIVKHSTPTKLTLLCFEMLRDLCISLYALCTHLYYIGIELIKYSAIGYRALGRGVDKARLSYANTKLKLEKLREDGRKKATEVNVTSDQRTKLD